MLERGDTQYDIYLTDENRERILIEAIIFSGVRNPRIPQILSDVVAGSASNSLR